MKENQNQFIWWQKGIIYQVYPRSYQDSNNDGVGDLKGITSRLDYLKWLGVEALWISPIFPSPMADFGYDIADYCDIHPLFGTMQDFDKLLQEVHAREMKLILDLVPNHTSDQHPWFLEARSSRDNPKRDWYIWHDAKPDGAEPNNWLAMFGGSAWEWDEKTEQYYYHAFLKEQPDLNWRNPEVQEAMFNVMRFWLDKGVDGFRVDVMWHMIKDEQLRNNPKNPDYKPHMATYEQLIPAYSTDQPEVHAIVQMMRQVTDSYEERLLIGEIYLPIEKLVTYYGTEQQEAHLPFNFQLLTLPWDATEIAAAIDTYEGTLPPDGWPNWVLGNHDQPRLASRIGPEQARVAAMLLLSLRGTPTIYYGEEIGMCNVTIPKEEVQDPQGLNMPDLDLSRDPSRTPMQWDTSINAGFSDGKPWLRLASDHKEVNVALQQDDPKSLLSLYKRLIKLRQQEPALHIGKYAPIHADKQVLAYVREAAEGQRFLVVLNMSAEPCKFESAHFEFNGTIEIACDPEKERVAVSNAINLERNEGLIIRLTA
ncbi:alpha-amylase family glycosyl hydrolase [Pontibacter arcticus]|uniref:Alpha-amylase n=1 Tax=Pontibacter arcticus TaxID=2080288 RepID=A0A364RF38_9BACT|nr:alpha-amylase family glycosyl hydrolase [Pontibacter arcticus]RAU82921.1 alpha-amylase [Pontibacter arcticus]